MNRRSSTHHPTGTRSMRSLHRLASIVMSLCIALLLGVSPAAAAPGPELEEQAPNVDPTVRCEPTAVSAGVGQTVSIDLYVQDVANLYGVDFRVSFDPTIGQVVDQNLFVPGTQIQPLYSWLFPGFIIHQETHSPSDIPPNCGVWCIWYATTQTNPTPPVNGAGPIARVTFLGLQAGTFPMNWINAQLSAPGGVPITPVLTQPCQVTFVDPLGVNLSSFEAAAQPDHILLTWETASELDNLGFNLYRGTSPSEPDRQLNSDLIPSAAPGSPSGFLYTWEDRQDLDSGTTYYYWLDAVDFANTPTRFGPVEATYLEPTALQLSELQVTTAPSQTKPVSFLLALATAGVALALGMQRSTRRRD